MLQLASRSLRVIIACSISVPAALRTDKVVGGQLSFCSYISIDATTLCAEERSGHVILVGRQHFSHCNCGLYSRDKNLSALQLASYSIP